MSAHHDALTHHYCCPACFGEKLVIFTEDLAIQAEQVRLFGQGFGYGHVAAIIPERAVIAAGGIIVQDQKIADAGIFFAGQAVECIFLRLCDTIEREQRDELVYTRIDQVDRRRFQWFHKTCGKAQSDDVFIPELFPASRREPQIVGIGPGLASDVPQQNRQGLVIRHKLAAIDMAIAVAMLQRHLPLPACLVGSGTGIGQGAATIFTNARKCYGAVARKEVGPVFISGLQRLFDQNAPKTRAIDEQIAFDDIAKAS